MGETRRWDREHYAERGEVGRGSWARPVGLEDHPVRPVELEDHQTRPVGMVEVQAYHLPHTP